MLYAPRIMSHEVKIMFYQRMLLGTSANQKRQYLKSYNNTIYSRHDIAEILLKLALSTNQSILFIKNLKNLFCESSKLKKKYQNIPKSSFFLIMENKLGMYFVIFYLSPEIWNCGKKAYIVLIISEFRI